MRHVELLMKKRPHGKCAKRMRSLVNCVLDRTGFGECEIHILLTDDDEIRKINREYRRINHATDVLSFPDGDALPEGGVFLGQIVISLDHARKQAENEGHDEIREIEELLIHGLLHLAGFDHETDSGHMDSLELSLRKECLR